MKIYFPIAVVAIAFASCTQVARQIDQKIEAKKKQDSILKAFKEVNEQLQKKHDSLLSRLDSTVKWDESSSGR